MKFIDYLKEEYVTVIDSPRSHEPVEIYRNPTKNDLMNMRKFIKNYNPEYRGTSLPPNMQLRFIADPVNEDLFVFLSALLHDEALTLLKNKGFLKNVNFADCLQSFCRVSPGGKLLDHYGNKYGNYLLNQMGKDITGPESFDWSWLKVYFK